MGSRFPLGWKRKQREHKSSTYSGGDGYINLYVAILRQAQDDGNGMWVEFIETDMYKMGIKSGNVNSLDVANWVAEYLTLS